MRRKSAVSAVALTVMALALGACGEDDSDDEIPAPGGDLGETLVLSADAGGALEFDDPALTASAGRVTIALANPSDVPHAIKVEGNGVEETGETVRKGGTSRVTIELKPGKYKYYCPVANHEAKGMAGKLTVD